MVFRVKRHAVVSLALPNRIPSNNLVSRGIDDGKDVLVLQVTYTFRAIGSY